MLKKLLVLTLYSTLRVCNGLDIDDDYELEYLPQLHGCLKLHQQPTDWLNAWSSCLREGAQLTSPWTYDFVSAINKLQSEEAKLQVLYSGARVLLPPYNAGEFRMMEAKNWQRCGVWYANGTSGEVDCKERLPFVCFAPVAPAPDPATISTSDSASTCVIPPTFTSDPGCGDKSLGYELADQTRRCYKFHTKPALWLEANSACAAEGARLATSDSPEETRVFTALFARYPAAATNDTTFKDHMFFGLYWDADASVWKTSDGKTFANVEHAKWEPGQPSELDKTRPYVFMHRKGKLTNWPDNQVSFICKKAPVLRR